MRADITDSALRYTEQIHLLAEAITLERERLDTYVGQLIEGCTGAPLKSLLASVEDSVANVNDSVSDIMRSIGKFHTLALTGKEVDTVESDSSRAGKEKEKQVFKPRKADETEATVLAHALGSDSPSSLKKLLTDPNTEAEREAHDILYQNFSEGDAPAWMTERDANPTESFLPLPDWFEAYQELFRNPPKLEKSTHPSSASAGRHDTAESSGLTQPANDAYGTTGPNSHMMSRSTVDTTSPTSKPSRITRFLEKLRSK